MNTNEMAAAAAARWDARVAADPSAKPRDEAERADKAASDWMCRCGRWGFYHYRFDHKGGAR